MTIELGVPPRDAAVIREKILDKFRPSRLRLETAEFIVWEKYQRKERYYFLVVTDAGDFIAYLEVLPDGLETWDVKKLTV